MAAGDTGAPRAGGGQGDAFTKREKANEDYSIKQREKEKLLELKKKLGEQQDHLKKLQEHIDELSKSQGGEQNWTKEETQCFTLGHMGEWMGNDMWDSRGWVMDQCTRAIIYIPLT